MGEPHRSRNGRRAASLIVASALALALLVAPALPELAGITAASAATAGVHPGAVSDHGFASWDTSAHNISSASQPSSAFTLRPGQTAHVNFTLFVSGGLLPADTVAQLQLTYLGVVLTTSKTDVRPTALDPSKGTAEVNFSLGPIYDALEGVFLLTATLGPSNGSSTYWSDGFYVCAKAPYLLESAAVIILLILLVAEVYWIASAFREAARPPSTGGAQATPPTGGPATPTATPAPGGDAGGAPAAPPPPPTGGST